MLLHYGHLFSTILSIWQIALAVFLVDDLSPLLSSLLFFVLRPQTHTPFLSPSRCLRHHLAFFPSADVVDHTTVFLAQVCLR
jgi:hypothetical protein